jgi:hypothetical protein
MTTISSGEISRSNKYATSLSVASTSSKLQQLFRSKIFEPFVTSNKASVGRQKAMCDRFLKFHFFHLSLIKQRAAQISKSWIAFVLARQGKWFV